MCAANDRKTESSLLLGLDERDVCSTWGLLRGFPFDAAELFCVCQDEVHVLEKSVGQYASHVKR